MTDRSPTDESPDDDPRGDRPASEDSRSDERPADERTGRRGALPVVDPPAPGSVDADVYGVVLAAGRSERFGSRNKLLAEVGGEPIVRRAVRTVAAARVEGVTVVLGHEADRVEAALAGLDVETVRNPEYERGQATSVRRGIEAVRDEADAAVVALGDMPFVDRDSVDALVAAYGAGAGEALAAAHRGERGNPALFGATHFDDLAAVEGDTGGRAILLDEGALVETGDPGVLRDVDAPDDLGDCIE